jgi:predicted transcriptional regulator
LLSHSLKLSKLKTALWFADPGGFKKVCGVLLSPALLCNLYFYYSKSIFKRQQPSLNFLLPKLGGGIFIMKNGFFWSPDSIIDRTDLSMKEKMCYMVLSRMANKSGQCFPSYRKIAEKMSCCRKTAMRAIYKLVELGLVVIKRQHRADGGWTSNLYSIVKYVPRGGDSPNTTNKDINCIKQKDKHLTKINNEKRKMIQALYLS